MNRGRTHAVLPLMFAGIAVAVCLVVLVREFLR